MSTYNCKRKNTTNLIYKNGIYIAKFKTKN